MESNISKAIHPSLCPVLILLSRLKPSVIISGSDDALDPSLFMPFIQKCATQSNLRVRVLASRALTGLVSNEKLQTVICDVAHGLPVTRNQMSMPTEHSLDLSGSAKTCNDFGTVGTCAVSFNSIHGLLLQLSSLLDNNCRDLSDKLMKEQILGELIQVVSKCSWIGNIQICPCPILNSSYMRVLDLMLDITKTYTPSQHATTIRRLLLKLALVCLDADKFSSLSWSDPTTIELRRQATISYFNCLLEVNHAVPEKHVQLLSPAPKLSIQRVIETESSLSELQQKITSFVLDPNYEVRLATLKMLLQLVNSESPSSSGGVVHMWAKANLHSLLVKLLPVEEHPKCIYYVLKIFFKWNFLQLDESTDSQCCTAADPDFLFYFWDWLINLYRVVKRVKIREITLCCMGICVKQLVSLLKIYFSIDQSQIIDETSTVSRKPTQFEKWVRAFRSIDSFVSLVKHHSAPSEPVNMRKAAAEAIVASGLLAEAKSVASHVSNSHLRFDEADNVDVEEKIPLSQTPEVINLYACRILDLWFTCVQLLEDEDNGLRQRLAKDIQNCISSTATFCSCYLDAVPTQVDRVIESSFDFLSSIFGYWLEYMKYLVNWVLRTSSFVSAQGDPVRRVFDKEIDNHHEEKLLICQLCCLHLGNLLDPKSCVVQVHEFSSIWRLRFLRQLISVADGFLEIVGISDWVGGIGNHRDAFVSVYANLLGIYALSQQPYDLNSLECSVDNNKLYLSEFPHVERIIRPFLRNPLISNLYNLVMQSHERLIGVSATQGDISLNADFDPYFLVR